MNNRLIDFLIKENELYNYCECIIYHNFYNHLALTTLPDDFEWRKTKQGYNYWELLNDKWKEYGL